MNSRQRRKFKKFALKILKEEAFNITKDTMLSEMIELQYQLTRWEKYQNLKIKLDAGYGKHLDGNWFYIIPANVAAESALKLQLDEGMSW